MSAVTITGGCKSYGGPPVLDNLNLTVPAGSITALLGASGSGKTTLLRSIAGFDRLDAGTITIADKIVDDGDTVVHTQHRGIGYVPQEGALFPHLRVAANIGFGLRRRDRESSRERVAELIKLLHLGSLEHRFPHQLSGGQRQRVALARALATKPLVVLLDEPFASLDTQLRVSLRQQIAEVLRGVGATVILVTHDRDEALVMADQIALLHRGRIVATGTPRDLYTNPQDEHVARFLGPANYLSAKIVAGQVQCPVPVSGPAADLPDGNYTLLVRPEHFGVATDPEERAVQATVLEVAYKGPRSDLRLQVDGASTDLLVEAAGDQQFLPAQSVWIRATPVSAWPESQAKL